MRRLLTAAVLLTLTSGAAAQEEPSVAPHVEPFFKVSGKHLDRRFPGVGGYYPERSFRYGVQGGALIECRLGEGGVLDDCVVAAEAPTDSQFGEASLRMAQQRALMAKLPSDTPLRPGDKVRLIVPFKIRR